MRTGTAPPFGGAVLSERPGVGTPTTDDDADADADDDADDDDDDDANTHDIIRTEPHAS